MKRPACLLLAVALMCVGCGSDAPQDPATPHAGVDGTVYRGPTEPVVRPGQGSGTETFAATFHVYRDAGGGVEPVGDFQTRQDGKFHLDLEPGTYRIVPDASAPILFPESQVKTIDVIAEHVINVRLDFDTGIR